MGRWPATITCIFSDRTAYSVPSLALRRAGLPSCASQQKSDGQQLPCGEPLPEHGTTTLHYFASKQTTGYAAFGSRRDITLSFSKIFCPASSMPLFLRMPLYTTINTAAFRYIRILAVGYIFRCWICPTYLVALHVIPLYLIQVYVRTCRCTFSMLALFRGTVYPIPLYIPWTTAVPYSVVHAAVVPCSVVP